MIKESISKLKGKELEAIINKPRKSKQDWITIALDYYKPSNKGLTQKDYARKRGINYKTFNDAMIRFRSDIIKNLNKKIKDGKLEDSVHRPKSIDEQFMDSVVANYKIMTTKKSLAWYQSTMRKVIKGRRRKFVSSYKAMTIGKIYTYAYDPLTKDKLPYWDQYPLIVFMGHYYGETTKRYYFKGLNLHYVDPNTRVSYLRNLLKLYASTKTLRAETRLQLSWSDVKGDGLSDIMIKSYLPNHVLTKIQEVPPTEWLNIIKLPFQKFTTDDFSLNKDELVIY